MGHNMGVTCLSIALSNFLCSKRLSSVAYVELNPTGQIGLLARKSNCRVFSKKGIDFYPATLLSGLTEILKLDYDYIVVDFGILNTFTIPEFKRCKLRYGICSYSPWKVKQKESFITLLKENDINIDEDIKLLGNSGKETTIPFLSNPFQLTSQTFRFFEGILGGN